MANDTTAVKLGVCTVLFDGIDLGFTKGGVEVEVTTSTHEVKVDQFGETPIGELLTGRMVKAKVPMAETTLENLALTMPGSTLVTNGIKATGTVTFATTAPVNTDSVTIGGVTFTFKTAPVAGVPTDLAIPGSINAAATALAAAINAYPMPYSAVAAAGVVTVTAKQTGVAFNVAITKTAVTPANLTVVGLTGGADATKAKVQVKTGVNVSLLALAKTLILRPVGTIGEDDFTIFKAATPGALSYAYNIDQERIFNVDFKGYALSNGDLFAVGNSTAV